MSGYGTAVSLPRAIEKRISRFKRVYIMNEDRLFHMLSVAIFAIAIAFVLVVHKLSIEELHKRVTQLESQVSKFESTEKVVQ